MNNPVDSTQSIRIPFNSILWNDHITYYIRVNILFGLRLFLLFIFSLSLAPDYFYFYALCALILGLVIISWFFNPSYSIIKFQQRELIQVRQIFKIIKIKSIDLQKFDCVMSEYRINQQNISKAIINVTIYNRLSGKKIQVTQFLKYLNCSENGPSDHPEARALRSMLSKKLGLRDLGVI